MSRFSDYDDFEGEPEQILAMGRWERNARAVLKSKRGRKALAELREALMALPEHRLIEGAVCTVGAAERHQRLIDQEEACWAQLDPKWRPPTPDGLYVTEQLDHLVARDGEGVCAVGAYAWYRKVKAGMDPAEAFASLPDLAEEGSNALGETADLGEAAGMTYTLAWELAYKNDETFSRAAPEQRWQHFVDWIDRQLAVAA